MKVVRINENDIKKGKKVEKEFEKTKKFKTNDVNRILKDLDLIESPQNFSVDKILTNTVVFREGIFGVEIEYLYTEDEVTDTNIISFNGNTGAWHQGLVKSEIF